MRTQTLVFSIAVIFLVADLSVVQLQTWGLLSWRMNYSLLLLAGFVGFLVTGIALYVRNHWNVTFTPKSPSELPPPPPAPPSVIKEKETITKEVVVVPCQYCGNLMPQTSISCPHCGGKRKA